MSTTPSSSSFERNLIETKVKHEKTPYYDNAEKGMEGQWKFFIEPRLVGMDFTRILELAPGHGRNTAKLRPKATEMYLVDINQNCVDACRQRFGGEKGEPGPDGHACLMHYDVNDGYTLPMVPSGVITLVYSWDAMVHFDKRVVEKYVHEFARIMAPGAKGFVHHSNYGSFAPDPESNWLSNPGWRSTMSRELFAKFCEDAKLRVNRQDVINWGEPNLDCISLFEKPA
jgi:ubiquinone/menaquinone biosynthesis C-methylase UbiE